MRTTARPRSRTRLMVSMTLWVWTTPSAAVGSSRKSTLLAQATDRAIATDCFWPPDIAPTGTTTERTAEPSSVKDAAAFGAHRRVVHEPELPQHARPHELAAEEHVLGRVEVRGEREVLVHDLDADRGGVVRRREVHRLALEEHLARVDVEVAREGLDEGRLAGAVVADQGDDLAGVDVEVGPVEGLDAPEAAGQARGPRTARSCDGLPVRAGTALDDRTCTRPSGGARSRTGTRTRSSWSIDTVSFQIARPAMKPLAPPSSQLTRSTLANSSDETPGREHGPRDGEALGEPPAGLGAAGVLELEQARLEVVDEDGGLDDRVGPGLGGERGLAGQRVDEVLDDRRHVLCGAVLDERPAAPRAPRP